MHGACCHAGDDPLVTCRKILCFKETLQFPPEAPHLSMAKRASLPAAAQTAIRRPRSPPASSGRPSGPERGEASSRGCRGEAGAAAPWCQAQSRRFHRRWPSRLSAHAESLIRSLLCDREERLGKEGAEQIKGHPFFNGIDWSSLRCADAAPFKPHVESATDTSHFDKFEERPPNEPGAAVGDTDSRISDTDLAFLGYQYKRYPSCSDVVLNAVSESSDRDEPGSGGSRPDRRPSWSASSATSPVTASPPPPPPAPSPPPPPPPPEAP
jgi:hypothetical protein